MRGYFNGTKARDGKRHNCGGFLKAYASLHLYLGLFYAFLRLTLVPCSLHLKRATYPLYSDQNILTYLVRSSHNEKESELLGSFLSVFLPHGLNNFVSHNDTLSSVIMKGAFANLIISLVAALLAFSLKHVDAIHTHVFFRNLPRTATALRLFPSRLSPLTNAGRDFLCRLAFTLLVGFEILFLTFTILFFACHAGTNWKVPGAFFHVWPELSFSAFLQASLVRPEAWADSAGLSALTDPHTIRSLHRLTNIKGFSALMKLVAPNAPSAWIIRHSWRLPIEAVRHPVSRKALIVICLSILAVLVDFVVTVLRVRMAWNWLTHRHCEGEVFPRVSLLKKFRLGPFTEHSSSSDESAKAQRATSEANEADQTQGGMETELRRRHGGGTVMPAHVEDAQEEVVVKGYDREPRRLRPYWLLLALPYVYFVVSGTMAYLFLIRYPTCSMRDAFYWAPGQFHHADYVYLSKGIRPTGSSHPAHLDIYLPTVVVQKWAEKHSTKASTETVDERLTPDDFPDETDDHRPPKGEDWTFFMATRYNRRMNLRWPFGAFSVWQQNIGDNSVAVFTWPMTQGLLKANIPVITMDATGSGSASGIRPIDLDDSEIADILLAIQWIKEQFWSNGKIAAGGISYDGMTGLKAAARRHQNAIDLIVALYTPMHPITELLQSNGVQCASFVDDYGGLTRAFEREGNPAMHLLLSYTSKIPLHIILGFVFVFRLPQTPRGLEESFSRSVNLRARDQNWSLRNVANSRYFLDDSVSLVDGRIVGASRAGLNTFDFQEIIDSNIPTYWTAAYCDSSAVAAATRYFERLNHDRAGHRLILGPWGHGGRRGCPLLDPQSGSWSCAEYSVYQHLADFIRHHERPSEIFNFVDDERNPHWTRTRVGSDDMEVFPGAPLPLIGQAILTNSTIRPAPLRSTAHLTLSTKHGQPVFESQDDRFEVIAPKNTNVSLSYLTMPQSFQHEWEMYKGKDMGGFATLLVEYGTTLGARLPTFLKSGMSKMLSKPRVPDVRVQRGSYVEVTPYREFSDLGFMSRWTIVQHLFRSPIDVSFALSRAYERGGLMRLSTKIQRNVTILGAPKLHIPLLIGRSDLPRFDQGAYHDLAITAILHVRTTDGRLIYLSESRALLSMSSKGQQYIHIYDQEGMRSVLERLVEMPSSLRETVSTSQKFVTEEFLEDEMIFLFTHLTMDLEQISATLDENTELELTLMPEDKSNFPWYKIAEKFRGYHIRNVEDPLTIPGRTNAANATQLAEITTWRIPLLRPTFPPRKDQLIPIGQFTLILPLAA